MVNIHSYRIKLTLIYVGIEFWKTIENDYCQVFVIDQSTNYYSIEIKYDYLAMIRKRRAILFVNNNNFSNKDKFIS